MPRLSRLVVNGDKLREVVGHEPTQDEIVIWNRAMLALLESVDTYPEDKKVANKFTAAYQELRVWTI